MPAVSVRGLSKGYGVSLGRPGRRFLRRAGEVFALLGPNGAGSTTTVEILEGFRQRDRGEVSVLGFDPAAASTSRGSGERIGVVLQELAVEPFLSVRQALARSAGDHPSPLPVEEVLHLLGLSRRLETGSRHSREASSAVSTSGWASSAIPSCCSWTSPRPALTPRHGEVPGTSCGASRAEAPR